jgi:hypothetical protein
VAISFKLSIKIYFRTNQGKNYLIVQKTKWSQSQTDYFYATAEEMKVLGCGASGCPYNKTRAELMANLFNQFYSTSCSGFTDLLAVCQRNIFYFTFFIMQQTKNNKLIKLII